jgi:hypothetical protein
METTPTFISTLFLSVLVFLAAPVFAHQPMVVESDKVAVVDPEVSKAYYGELSGTPHEYSISSTEPFKLYVGILIPYAEDSKKDVVAEIRKGDEMIQMIGGKEAEWKEMFEFFGQSTYWDGGEYKERVEAGEYTISVSSLNNNSKYSIAIGQIEAFNVRETINAFKLIPWLKNNFFNESPISFIRSPFGWGYIILVYIIAFVFGFLYRFALKKSANRSIQKVRKNIGKKDRIIRLALWFGLLIWAVTTSWSPILLFFSGFALFEAIFSWCGLYAAIGKNTCHN